MHPWIMGQAGGTENGEGIGSGPVPLQTTSMTFSGVECGAGVETGITTIKVCAIRDAG